MCMLIGRREAIGYGDPIAYHRCLSAAMKQWVQYSVNAAHTLRKCGLRCACNRSSDTAYSVSVPIASFYRPHSVLCDGQQSGTSMLSTDTQLMCVVHCSTGPLSRHVSLTALFILSGKNIWPRGLMFVLQLHQTFW